MVELWDILDKNGNVTGRVHERGKPMNKGGKVTVPHPRKELDPKTVKSICNQANIEL